MDSSICASNFVSLVLRESHDDLRFELHFVRSQLVSNPHSLRFGDNSTYASSFTSFALSLS
ncbi:MAG TPA: hypothetical protein PLC67_10270, partial [Spirochaetota bacterium]|nr:hypothetical protein [Spirochaetota bacterium]